MSLLTFLRFYGSMITDSLCSIDHGNLFPVSDSLSFNIAIVFHLSIETDLVRFDFSMNQMRGVTVSQTFSPIYSQ